MQNSAKSILEILEVCKTCVYSQVEVFFLFMSNISSYLVLIAVRIIHSNLEHCLHRHVQTQT